MVVVVFTSFYCCLLFIITFELFFHHSGIAPMSHFPTDIVYAFKVHRTSTKLNKRGKNFAVVYLPFHASPDNLTLETVFSKIGLVRSIFWEAKVEFYEQNISVSVVLCIE